MSTGTPSASSPAMPNRVSLTVSRSIRSFNERSFRWKNVRAFTLLELLAVIAIVGILTAIVIGVGRHAAQASEIARAKAEMAALATALEAYKSQYGDYPQVTSDGALSDTEAGEELYSALNGERGPKLGSSEFATQQRVLFERTRFTLADLISPQRAPNHFVDPWGEPYRYAYNTSANGWKSSSYILVCSGPDRDLTLPLPATGVIDATYERAERAGKAVNVDNIYANRN